MDAVISIFLVKNEMVSENFTEAQDSANVS